MAKSPRKTITLPLDEYKFLEFLKRGVELQVKQKLTWGEFLRTLVPPGILHILGSPVTDELLKERKESIKEMSEVFEKIKEKDKKLGGGKKEG